MSKINNTDHILEYDDQNDIIYRTMGIDDIDEAISVFAKCFYEGEPITSNQATNWSKKDWIGFSALFVPRMAKEGNTVVAINRKNQCIVGGCLNEDFSAPLPQDMGTFIDNADGNPGAVMAIVDELECFLLKQRNISGVDAVPTGKLFHLWMLGVLPEMRGKGIARKSARLSLELAKNKSFDLAFAECTGAYSAYIFVHKENCKAAHIIRYDNWEYNGEKPFQRLPNAGHAGMTLAVYDFTQSA